MSQSKKRIERGQSITFRVPSDTPDYLLKQLQTLRETAKRNFSSEITQFVLKGVNETYSRERETVTIPLPKKLTKEQKNWLDRKSTRLNSSHVAISYAVFCLQKKNYYNVI